MPTSAKNRFNILHNSSTVSRDQIERKVNLVPKEVQHPKWRQFMDCVYDAFDRGSI